MSVTWYLQAGSKTSEGLAYACEAEAIPFHTFQAVPFARELPDLPPSEGRAVLYGSTSVILAAKGSERWRDSVWFDADLFKPSVYTARYGELMLNADARFVSVEELASERHALDERLFVRPDDDLKQFSGGVMTFEEFKRWADGFSGVYDTMLNAGTELVVASPKPIAGEVRAVVVGGRCITASMYSPVVGACCNEHMQREVGGIAARWSPADAFVMDLALLRDGSMKVIELNCLNGSGLYDCDLRAVVREVNR